MAGSNRLISLSLGSQTVRMAEFRADSRGGLILRAYRTAELLADPASDATRVAQTSVAVKQLIGEGKAAGTWVNYSIPAQSVFTRFVKLPQVGEEKIDQIVHFEAQQNVPFPIEEVVWDYQLLSSSDSGRFEVVLVAIKSDLLEELNDAVEDASVRTSVADVSPMATYNAFRYNYSDLTGCSMVIDIGARTTNLLFIEPKKVFSRSIPIGGNTITAAIAKDFDEPFAVAEERKKRQGFVSLGGAYAEPSDPEIARVSKMIRNTMTRLHAEISRSISFYRSQQGGAQPERVFLSGGAVAMPYMREFFSEKLALPIEFFNPLRNVAAGSQVDVNAISQDAHLLGELVGLALRNNNACPMELNLRPASVVKAQEMAARRPYIAMAGACLLLTLGGWHLYLQQAAGVYEQVLDKLRPQVAALQSVEKQFKQVSDEIKARQDSITPLTQVIAERDYWVKVIDDVNSRLPARFVWVSSFEVGIPKLATPAPTTTVSAKTTVKKVAATEALAPQVPQLILKGFYLSNPKQGAVVDEFAKALAGSPYFNIDLKNSKALMPVRATGDDRGWTFEYELHLPLKAPLAL